MIMEIRIHNLSAPFFSSVASLAGLAIALQGASDLCSPLQQTGLLSALLASAVFILLTRLYHVKAVRHPMIMVDELSHPVKMRFTITIRISPGLVVIVLYLLVHPLITIWQRQTCVEAHQC
jgi:tellurite resistance protein TehA-like permease